MDDMLSCFLAFLIGAGIRNAIVFVCETFIRKYYQSKKKISIIDDKNFSTSKYLEKIEKVHLSILEEKEKTKPYRITLWWGLDGCRLNEVGEVEWIIRRTNQIPISTKGFRNVSFNYTPYANTAYFQIPYLTYQYQNVGHGIQHMTNGINSSIQSQLDQLQFQQAQMLQNSFLCNSLSFGRDMSGRIIRQ